MVQRTRLLTQCRFCEVSKVEEEEDMEEEGEGFESGSVEE
jgi:hypothetical protein